MENSLDQLSRYDSEQLTLAHFFDYFSQTMTL
jgi:hypothetical protein